MDFKHVSVLLNETIDGLNINPDGIYVDGKRVRENERRIRARAHV